MGHTICRSVRRARTNAVHLRPFLLFTDRSSLKMNRKKEEKTELFDVLETRHHKSGKAVPRESIASLSSWTLFRVLKAKEKKNCHFNFSDVMNLTLRRIIARAQVALNNKERCAMNGVATPFISPSALRLDCFAELFICPMRCVDAATNCTAKASRSPRAVSFICERTTSPSFLLTNSS